MKKPVLFVGIDVDDKSFHVAGTQGSQGGKACELAFEFKCKPSVAALFKCLETKQQGGFELKCCYEATYLGYTLKRSLESKGIGCEVIAPSLVPRKAGKKVKTDRIDAGKLAKFYASGELTVVHAPSEQEEADRDFIRSRNFSKDLAKSLKGHIISVCRRLGLDYKASTGCPSFWTDKHRNWLQSMANQQTERVKENLNALILQLHDIEKAICFYDEKIVELSQTPKYKPVTKALCCFRGISTHSAMVLATEFVDIRRFAHPKQTAGYAGLDIVEYSSGGHERKYSITKDGNRHIRTVAVEAMQTPWTQPKVGKRLSKDRQGAPPSVIAIADKCMARLHKKSTRMLYAGKGKNKIKVACARELLCFVWEAMNEVA